jgi:hypothetical protein
MNFDELKTLNRSALISELIDKTNRCAFVWNSIAVGQYKTTSASYDMYLTRASQDNYILDVVKNANPYRSYNSNIMPDVKELYDTVDALSVNSTNLERAKVLMATFSQIRGCGPQTYTEVSSGGIKISSSGLVQQLVQSSLLLLPTSLTFGPTIFPWSGSVTDIDDSPNVASHDSDATYIRQQTSGPLPTQWGYAIAGFNVGAIPTNDPRQIRLRIAARREVEVGVNVIIELLIASAVIFSATFTPTSTYSIYNSGLITVPTGTNISSLQARLSMFTNTGNSLPRALRVSAVDIFVVSYSII